MKIILSVFFLLFGMSMGLSFASYYYEQKIEWMKAHPPAAMCVEVDVSYL